MTLTSKFFILTVLSICTLAWSPLASAELYKCKDASGKTTYQETPCTNEQTQKKLRKDTDDGTSQSNGRTARGEAINGANGEKRYPLERSPSRTEMESCISAHRKDLANVGEHFSVQGSTFKRVWPLDNGGTGERNIVVVNVQEKNRLGYAERASFTCTLRGDYTIDADATKEFVRN